MNLSRLTMLDVMVHELSHGWNFVLAARCAAPILNLDTPINVPHTEGMALHRELEFYVSAADLMTKSNPTHAEQALLDLYEPNTADREKGDS